MIRTQIQLDEDLYSALKERAYKSGKSMSAVVRDILGREFRAGVMSKGKKRSLEDFSFVNLGSSVQGDLAPVSERHDEALDEIYLD